jgi:hypothetical protein
MHRSAYAPAGAISDAGLLVSLSYALQRPGGPLGRRARALARRLADGPADRALRLRAADLLAVLLTASDSGTAADDDELLDEEFDA